MPRYNLGTREVAGCKIDLWQGQSEDFACDFRAELAPTFAPEWAGKHVALSIGKALESQLSELAATIDAGKNLPRRITLVVEIDDDAAYLRWQQILWQVFPESKSS